MGRSGDTGTRCWGDGGDAETGRGDRRHGNANTKYLLIRPSLPISAPRVTASPLLPFSRSPRLPFSPSHLLPISPSPHLRVPCPASPWPYLPLSTLCYNPASLPQELHNSVFRRQRWRHESECSSESATRHRRATLQNYPWRPIFTARTNPTVTAT